MVTVGMLHGHILSVQTLGRLYRIPASETAGALLIMKKNLYQRLRTRHARRRNPFLLLSALPVPSLLQTPADLGLLWPRVPESSVLWELGVGDFLGRAKAGGVSPSP